MNGKTAVIIGAGPAGLTAAYELATRAGVRPIVLEQSEYMGGISRTVNYRGNRIDIGGHRFFSKSDRVMEWWQRMLPLAEAGSEAERVMLLRPRKSRVYYLRRFFDYPVSLSATTIGNLGLARTFGIGVSYLRSALFPIRPETNLEEFLINRFGRALYRTFFESYTEKVWGVPCRQIGAEWGAQRIKGLSIRKTLAHAAGKLFGRKGGGVGQKNTETSLIEQFLYPKYGPGQMWEEAARRVRELGGEILTGRTVDRVHHDGERATAVETVTAAGVRETWAGDYFFSTMPIRELVPALAPAAPANVQEVAEGLVYRDFITVGLLVRSLRIHDETAQGKKLVADNWIYIQEPDVLLGRLQIFNNWSPHLVADPSTVWLGLEYFCNTSDEIWSWSDERLRAFAVEELSRIGIVEAEAVLDATVLRMPKTYPAYFGSYARFAEIRAFTDRISNLFLIGRNGMHRYNNQDHSMLTAMMAVDGIVAGTVDRAALWEVNTESEYHEQRSQGGSEGPANDSGARSAKTVASPTGSGLAK